MTSEKVRNTIFRVQNTKQGKVDVFRGKIERS